MSDADFFTRDHLVRDAHIITGPAKAVLWALASYANPKTGRDAWPSTGTIAKAAGLAKSTVKEGLAELEERFGVVVRVGMRPITDDEGNETVERVINFDLLAYCNPGDRSPEAEAYRASLPPKPVRASRTPKAQRPGGPSGGRVTGSVPGGVGRTAARGWGAARPGGGAQRGPNKNQDKNQDKNHVDPADRSGQNRASWSHGLSTDLLAEITAALEGHEGSEWYGDKGRCLYVTDVSALLDLVGTRLVESGRVTDPTAYLRPIVRKANYPEAMKVALVNAYYLAEAS